MKRKRFIIISILGVVLLDAGFELFRYSCATSVVRKCKMQLESSLSPSASPEDARRCLETNGFDVVQWDSHAPHGWVGSCESISSQGTNRTLVVVGYKKNAILWPIRTDRWIEATFHFDQSYTYLVAEVNLSPISVNKESD